MALLRHATTIFCRTGVTLQQEPCWQGRCLVILGVMLAIRDQFEEARARFEEAKAAFLEADDETGAACCLLDASVIYSMYGTFERSNAIFREAKTLFERHVQGSPEATSRRRRWTVIPLETEDEPRRKPLEYHPSIRSDLGYGLMQHLARQRRFASHQHPSKAFTEPLPVAQDSSSPAVRTVLGPYSAPKPFQLLRSMGSMPPVSAGIGH